MEYQDPGRCIPIIFLLYSWGSLFGVPSKVPLSSKGILTQGDLVSGFLEKKWKLLCYLGFIGF